MQYLPGRRDEQGVRYLSQSSSWSPFIDDIAVTARRLERLRPPDVTVLAPR